MAQVTTGLHALLSRPAVYDLFQDAMGANGSRARFCQDHVRASPGDTIVDVGCGTAAILDHLPPGIHYHGFDLSASYIAAARDRHAQGTFECRDITELDAADMPACQVAIAVGLLHHLDDAAVERLLRALHARLAPGGRVVTLDPAFHDGQSPIARFLVSRDRGRNVREAGRYAALAGRVFGEVRVTLRTDLLRVPYSHEVLECMH